MKICLIGLGLMEIPPKSWGAVEIIIWDLKCTLEKRGHSVYIINTKNTEEIYQKIESFKPDFIHIHYDCYVDIAIKLYDTYKERIAITSHFGYLEQTKHEHFKHYKLLFDKFVTSKFQIIALSEGIREIYLKHGVNPTRIHVIPNGVRIDLFKFKKEPIYSNRTVYLAKIEPRKRQYLFQNIDNLYFVGKSIDDRFIKSKNYLGEWSKDYLYENLTNYANLALLSDGEAHPLVCLEALASGLGLVLSEYAAANLDLSKTFIDIIPENRITDIEYVSFIIKENRKKSIVCRDEIRQYALNFDYENIVDKIYIPTINKLLGEYT